MKPYPNPTGMPARRLTLKELPPEERPRERLLQRGPDALTEAELLAIVIRDGTREESALDLARRLVKMSGGLRGLSQMSIAELCRVKGIGPARAAQVKAALSLARRLGAQTLRPGQRFTCAQDVYDHFHPALRYLKKERFLCVLLDVKNRVIREEVISEGGLTAAMLDPKELLRAAVAASAAAMIVVHNHPSGDPQPSRDDLQVTRRIREVCNLAGIRLLDHVVIGEEGFVSLAETGRM